MIDEGELDALRENMGRCLVHFQSRAQKATAEVERMRAMGFGNDEPLLMRAMRVADVAYTEFKAFERAVEARPDPNSRKGALDDWQRLAQGRIPDTRGRGRPKDLEATLRREAAEGLRLFFEDEDPEDFEIWIAWLGVLRMWHHMNPGRDEPLIADQVGWLHEAEQEYKATRRGQHTNSGTSGEWIRKYGAICDLLLKKLNSACPSPKHLGR